LNDPGSGAASAGYLELLRSNRDFRRIWIGDVASMLGDWFNMIAMYVLVRELTGSPLALALVFLTKILPFALAAPIAGLIADRFNRRRLMIVSDLLRAVVVLGFLWVDRAADLPLLYLLSSLQIGIGALFIPARSASIPNITSPRELLTANALSAATWSTLLAVGAALGGFVTEWLGTDAVFVIDSASYLVSAAFIARTVIPQSTAPPAPGSLLSAAARDVAAGWRRILDRPPVARMAIAKAAWSVGGGGLVYMLALMGEHVAGVAPAVGMGLLYGARGFGTGVGPIAMRAWLPDEKRWPAMLGFGLIFTGAMYLAIGAMPWSLWVVLPIVLGHASSGANWVASTVLLQKRTVDRYRGRVFATEWLLLMLTDAVSLTVASSLLEAGIVDLRGGILIFAALSAFTGLLWLALVVPRERALYRAETAAGTDGQSALSSQARARSDRA
jgi:MFS family permease